MGKGTVVKRLVDRDPRLHLSRSWTTRAPRPGERPDAYTFVDRPTFEAHAESGGFLEWAEFLGQLYGSPRPEAVDDGDLVLEIDVQGARQVARDAPDALLVLLDAPDREVQRERLLGRGDDPDAVQRRLDKADEEVGAAHELGAVLVVNDDLEATIARLAELIDRERAARTGAGGYRDGGRAD